MRRLLAVLLILTASCLAQRKPDAAAQGLHGSVHSVRVEFRQGPSGDLQLDSEQTFNSEGWLTETKQYGPGNELRSQTLFKRNGARMLESDSTRFLPAESAERIVTTFEEHGFPIQQITYNLDGTVRERMQVIYEETQIRELHYDGNDKLITTPTISTLHDANSPDRHIVQRANGKTESVTELHQTHGRLQVNQQEYKDGKPGEQSVRDITPTGSSSATLHADATTSAASTRNGEFNEVVNPDGSHMKSQFNDQGQRVEEDRYDAADKLTDKTTFTYETDDHGNWTRRTATSGSDPGSRSVMVRTITYY